MKEGAVTPQQLASLLKLLQSGEVAGSSAKQVPGRLCLSVCQSVCFIGCFLSPDPW